MTVPFDLATAQSPAAGIPTYEPSKVDEKMIRDAIAYLVVKSPFFAHLLYNEMKLAFTEHPSVPYGATDGHTVFINPAGCRQGDWTLAQVAFLIAHEIAHGFLRDLIMAVRWRADGHVIYAGGKKLKYDHETMNAAEDYRINAMLIESKIGKMPPVGLFDANISAKGMEAAVEIYAKVYDPQDGRDVHGRKGKGFDVHLAPADAAVKQDPARIQQAIVAAVMAADASGQGTVPGAVRQLLGDILDPKVSWQDQLRATMFRKGGDPLYDWRYLDRRLLAQTPEPMYFARMSHTGAGTIVIGYDTSGSCVSAKMQQRFFAEMGGIVSDLNPQTLIVIWCDAKVQRVDELDEPEDLVELRNDINKKGGAPGGGGTNFKPVFKYVAKHDIQPDMLVFLTDTYGDFPSQEPDYPVIWASIVKQPTVPWGDVVEVEL